MKITALEMHCESIASTLDFYKNTIGLPVLYNDEEKVVFAAGSTKLVFRKSFDDKPVYHFAFNIPGNKFEEAFLWACSKFTLFNITPQTTIANFTGWNARAFYFLDNNQNIVEFIARYDLHVNSDRPFNGRSILSVSEIGLVVENVEAFCEVLMEDFDLNYFEKQTPQKDFAPIGNDEGLLIVVANNRKWYPTDILSSSFYTRVEFEQNGRFEEFEINEDHALVVK
jgi:catechol-2,3-dioxygenase